LAEEPMLGYRHLVAAHSCAVSVSPVPNLGRKLIPFPVGQVRKYDYEQKQYRDANERS
jgi:hypothetical protein